MDRTSKAFVAVAVAGILVAIYHSYGEMTYYSGPGSAVCNVNAFISCTSVFASGDVSFPPGPFGLPLYVYGLVWFPLLAALGTWYGRRRGALNGELLFPLLMVGNLFTLYLWYLELGVIHALCPVCITMYVLNYAMTVVVARVLLAS